ncbi:18328_t:CDS:1 [Funneliformis geosporum]|uniref:10506_t:CDS:1 n=1 Tax=Funneliformis geosporum TaxID=1117311 RepID=A0A9W4SF36_9GLOM|nr:10506_t:CDS:1 [Funneliformis geosporum]CAI2167105.1 18328_t:CDS:1 [Funneliformis geosporum]
MNSPTVKLLELWKASSEMTVGEITRYRIRFDPKKLRKSTIWPPQNLVLKVKNTTPIIYTIAILTGPYNISATCIETKHNDCSIFKQPLEIIPQTKAGIKCGETWEIKLNLGTGNSNEGEEEWIGDWTIEVLSDILFTNNKVQYEVILFAELTNITDELEEFLILDHKVKHEEEYQDGPTIIKASSPSISFEYFKPADVFSLPDLNEINKQNKPIHLVVLTHGIHGSMLDELYLKESIEEKCKDQSENEVVVYMSDVNHSGTEDGIENCGKRLAKNILVYVGWPSDNIFSSITSSSLVSPSKSKNFNCNRNLISKISFIGHSLGGLINVFLVGYLNNVTNGTFFKEVKPIHFITIASPLLGSTDLAWYLQFGMKLGAIGQTGKDLALIPRSKDEQHSASGVLEEGNSFPNIDSLNEEPLLLSLSRSNSSSHIALKSFKSRTLYANITNDVPVSLKSSSLYFINHYNGDDYVKDHSQITLLNQFKHLITTLMPPETTREYLNKSFSAKSPIIHDKLYLPSDIPPIPDTFSTSFEKDDDEEYHELPIEEQMARFWHKDMSWRKVLVRLEGEAHTHVIVRRKWQDAPGWQVINHLLNNHTF